MVRGRKPKPTAVKEASGAFRKDPQRRNQHEPVAPVGAPVMPDWIADDATALHCWKTTCELLSTMRILSEADSHPIAAYCSDFSQWCKLRSVVAGGNVSQSTEHGEKVSVEATQVHKYQDRMFKFWSEYGMTPSSRSRLIAKQATEDENPYGELVARMGQG